MPLPLPSNFNRLTTYTRLVLIIALLLSLAVVRSPAHAAPAEIASIYGLGGIAGVATNPTNNRIYTVGSGKLSVANGSTYALLHEPLTITINSADDVIAINGTTQRAYVAGCPTICSGSNGRLDAYNISVSPPQFLWSLNIGITPRGIEVNAEGNLVYVSGQGSAGGTVLRVDGATNQFAGAAYSVGSFPRGMGYNPTNDKLYVANSNGGSFSIIDTISGQITTLFIGSLLSSPQYVAVNPTSNKIFITNRTVGLHVIDGITNGITDVGYSRSLERVVYSNANNKLYLTVNTDIFNPAHVTMIGNGVTGVFENTLATNGVQHLAVNGAANRVYAADPTLRTVAALDTTNNQFVGGVWGLLTPNGVAVNPTTNRVYITNNGVQEQSRNFAIIDATTQGYVGVPKNPGEGTGTNIVAVNPQTDQVFMPGASGELKVFNGSTGALVQTISLNQTGLKHIAVNPTTNTIYTLNEGSQSLSVINGSTLAVVTNINLNWNSEGLMIAVNPTTNRVYVLFRGNVLGNVQSKITVINGATNAIVTEVQGWGLTGQWLVVNPATNKLYAFRVENLVNGHATIIDGATNTIDSTNITFNTRPDRAVFSQANNRLYVLAYDVVAATYRLRTINVTTNQLESTDITLPNQAAEMAINTTTGRIYLPIRDQDRVIVIEDAPTSVPPPSLISPEGITLGTLTPTYRWNAVSGATAYQLRVVIPATGAEVFSSTINASTCNGVTNVCETTPSNTLVNNGSYAWHVAAFKGTWGPYSDFKTFFPNVTPTTAPTLLTPSGVFSTTTLAPTYRWTPVTGAAIYGLAVFNMSTLSLQFFRGVEVSSCNATECAVTPTGEGTTLTNGGTYGWFVAAVNYAGVGPWSAGKAFIIFTTPAAPTLISPNGSVTNPITFTWNPVPGATQYFVNVLNAGGTQVIGVWVNASEACAVLPCRYTPAGSLPNGNYSWLVAAGNVAGTSGYSAAMNFTVTSGAAPEPAPTFAP